MKLYYFSALILGLLTLSACKKDKLEASRAILTGTWNWTESYQIDNYCADDSLWNYELIDSEDANTRYTLEFLEKGKVIFSHNDGEIWKKRIVFETEETIDNGPYDYHFVMLLNNKPDESLEVWVGQDSLLINDYPKDTDLECNEVFNHFTRE